MRYLACVLSWATLVGVCQYGSQHALVAIALAAGAPTKSEGLASAAAPSDKDVQVLTDANFEQETQAVTGSTSGKLQGLQPC